jgi:hypothetical protein
MLFFYATALEVYLKHEDKDVGQNYRKNTKYFLYIKEIILCNCDPNNRIGHYC